MLIEMAWGGGMRCHIHNVVIHDGVGDNDNDAAVAAILQT